MRKGRAVSKSPATFYVIEKRGRIILKKRNRVLNLSA